jgi:predicted phage terminase large subunit-like protein
VCYTTGTDGVCYVTDVVYTPEPMEITEGLVAEMLERNDTRLAHIESNNGGRGFSRAVQLLAPRVKVEWFHQSENKEARILSNSATVIHRIRMPVDWAMRWPAFYHDLSTYRRLFHANRHHDAADVLTGIIEKDVSASDARKKLRYLSSPVSSVSSGFSFHNF